MRTIKLLDMSTTPTVLPRDDFHTPKRVKREFLLPPSIKDEHRNAKLTAKASNRYCDEINDAFPVEFHYNIDNERVVSDSLYQRSFLLRR